MKDKDIKLINKKIGNYFGVIQTLEFDYGENETKDIIEKVADLCRKDDQMEKENNVMYEALQKVRLIAKSCASNPGLHDLSTLLFNAIDEAILKHDNKKEQ